MFRPTLRIIAVLLLMISKTRSITAISYEVRGKMGSEAEYAGPNEFAHQVSMQVYGKHVCGGTIIGERHALTAAHCVRDLAITHAQNHLYVEVGSSSINGGTRIKVIRYFMHSGFRGEQQPHGTIFTNDVAVLQLEQAVQESDSVKIMELPLENEEVPVGARTIVSGFGSAQMMGPQSRNLRKATMQVVSMSDCQYHWPHHIIIQSQICASYDRNQGTCAGDSGGPMIFNNKIIGIVSCGAGNCQDGTPDIFTKVSSFVSWIKKRIAQDLRKNSVRQGAFDSRFGSVPNWPSKPIMQPPNHNQISPSPIISQAPSNVVLLPPTVGHIPPNVNQVPTNIGPPSSSYPMLIYQSHPGLISPIHMPVVSHYPPSMIMHHPNGISSSNMHHFSTGYPRQSSLVPYHSGDPKNKSTATS